MSTIEIQTFAPASSFRQGSAPANLPRLERFAPGTTSKLNLAADCLIVTASVALATLTNTGCWRRTGVAATVAIAVWLLGARVLRQYDAHCEGILGELALSSVVVANVAVALGIFDHLLTGGRHADLGLFLLSAGPSIWFARVAVVTYRSGRVAPPEQVLIVGTGPLGRATAEDIRDLHRRRSVLGYLSWEHDSPAGDPSALLLGTWDDLAKCLEEHPVAEVYIAGAAHRDGETMEATLRTCERFGVSFALPAVGFRLTRARAMNAEGWADGYIHFSTVEHKPLQMVLKRVFDISASAVALWVLSPLLLLTALVIKLTSRGPVLFKQQRVGIHGQTFGMLKFRSMVSNAEELKKELFQWNEQSGPVFKMRNDPRITTVGRMIRKYSIDELPQLINVLRGDMSLVGPRPSLPSEVARYEPWQRRRLSVRPGLTCLWQVSGRNSIGFIDWMRLDMQYIDHWNFGRDLSLILRTVPIVVTGRGAS